MAMSRAPPAFFAVSTVKQPAAQWPSVSASQVAAVVTTPMTTTAPKVNRLRRRLQPMANKAVSKLAVSSTQISEIHSPILHSSPNSSVLRQIAVVSDYDQGADSVKVRWKTGSLSGWNMLY